MIPFIGGDFNSCIGDPSSFVNSLSWTYNSNIDTITNKHGRTFFRDFCSTCDIMPINCLKYRNINIDNDYTFIGGNGQSQIDIVLTDNRGKRDIRCFKILNENWHLSDHRPIVLEIEVSSNIDISRLLSRAQDLNLSNNDICRPITQFRGHYDYTMLERILLSKSTEIEESLSEYLATQDIDNAMKTIDHYLMAAHKNSRLRNVTTNSVDVDMTPVNKLFIEYQNTIADKDSSDESIEISYNRYKKERSKLTYEIMKIEMDCWNGSLENDNKTFWKYVDWKGNFKGKKQYDAPTMPEFQHFFEGLYDNEDKNELEEIKNLESEVYVPVLDDPISSEETLDAYEDMKKSGYDYNLPVLRILLANFTLIIVSILNLMFYVRYPLSLVTSLLSLIPKKGNLKLPKNFRGIQMLKTFACLYDRVITNRLKLWLPFHDNQTAFQKLKSTLLHIFTLRVLIFIVKRKKKKLFIGSMDIEKAFDIVPRLLLLKKLIRLGIGSCMLTALKALYSSTSSLLAY